MATLQKYLERFKCNPIDSECGRFCIAAVVALSIVALSIVVIASWYFLLIHRLVLSNWNTGLLSICIYISVFGFQGKKPTESNLESTFLISQMIQGKVSIQI